MSDLAGTVAGGRLRVQLTRFVGRAVELTELRQLICRHRLVTLTGTGGMGKTRLAAQLAGQLADHYRDGVWWVDLASVTDPDLVAVRVARTLALPDQPGRCTLDVLTRFVADRRALLVLDNCEHLLDGCAALTASLLAACPNLTILATSRESIGVAGELTWCTPSLSLADEAVELFIDRARLARPDFTAVADDAATVAAICRRLDGVPLAIELAAARVRALTLDDIADGLRDRFRLLTGGARSAVPRQQTLRASMDWSHALLSDPERTVFRRLAVFLGGFDLDSACATVGDGGLERFQILDGLSLLVDKSLVIAGGGGHATRYLLLETVREYALEKLSGSGEAHAVRTRHRDYYTALLAGQASAGYPRWVAQADLEIDNLRGAFAWSRENGDVELAARLASSLQPLWLRGRVKEGLAWLDAVLTDHRALTPAAHAGAVADKLMLDHLTGNLYHLDEAGQALAIARELDDPALLAQVLTACGLTCCYSPELALPHFIEAIQLARNLGDDGRLGQILGWQAYTSFIAGDLAAVRRAAGEGCDLADAVGDGLISRLCRWCIGLAQWVTGDLADAAAQGARVAAEARAVHDPMFSSCGSMLLAAALAYRGDTGGAAVAAEAAIEAASDLPGFQRGAALGALTDALLAAGDSAAAADAAKAAWEACPLAELAATNGNPVAAAALAAGDVTSARRRADDAVSVARGVHKMVLLATDVRVARAMGEVDRAERDARDALVIASTSKAWLMVPDLLECLAYLAIDAGDPRRAVRLLGSAQAVRDRTGQIRFKVYDADHEVAMDDLRNTMTANDFRVAWADGAVLPAAEAIAYAQRGSRECRRPSSGWTSLTPAELDVVRLVSEGLTNRQIAERLFVSPRTVQTHLTHVYAKLGVGSRVQLAQESARCG